MVKLLKHGFSGIKKKPLERVLKRCILINISCYKGNVTKGYILIYLILWYSEATINVLAMDKYINIVISYKAVRCS